MTKAVCIVGNKRSGSTQFMRLLNLHPNIFVSNESDIIWILYCFHHDKEIVPYRWDTPVGMDETLANYRDMLSKDKTPFENYVAIQTALMRNGSKKLSAMQKEPLLWIGDQKPFQQIDPDILPFIKTHFPDTKFLHLIRHPFPVIESSRVFKAGELWKGMSTAEILQRWTMHQQWVEQAKQQGDLPILDVKYEDIVEQAENTMRKVFDFLEVDSPPEVLQAARQSTVRLLKLHPRLDCPPETLEIMQAYGYAPTSSTLENKNYINLVNFWLKLKHKVTGSW